MRKLVLKMSISIDGFVSGPNGESEWVFRTGSDDARKWVYDTLSEAGIHIMGSRTFKQMAAFWPSSTLPLAKPMNEIPKGMFTRTGLPRAPHEQQGSWTDPLIASDNIADEIGRLKAQQGKNIVAHGGVGFAQALASHGLIDEYRLMVHPVALGSGHALFSSLSTPLDLHLTSATPFEGGAVAMVYRT